MAAGTKLSITYQTADGNAKTLSYSYVNPNVQASTVKALTAALVTNGSIFASPPVSIKSAKTVETTENDIDLS